MVIDFELSRHDFSTLNEIHEIIKVKIKELKKVNQINRIGYVAGKVTADGESKILENLERLKRFTEQISSQENIYVFSAAHVFNTEVYWKLNLPAPEHEVEFYKFWRKVLKSGVTDVYMSPDWENSLGASDEFAAANKMKLKIHFMEEKEI